MKGDAGRRSRPECWNDPKGAIGITVSALSPVLVVFYGNAPFTLETGLPGFFLDQNAWRWLSRMSGLAQHGAADGTTADTFAGRNGPGHRGALTGPERRGAGWLAIRHPKGGRRTRRGHIGELLAACVLRRFRTVCMAAGLRPACAFYCVGAYPGCTCGGSFAPSPCRETYECIAYGPCGLTRRCW